MSNGTPPEVTSAKFTERSEVTQNHADMVPRRNLPKRERPSQTISAQRHPSRGDCDWFVFPLIPTNVVGVWQASTSTSFVTVARPRGFNYAVFFSALRRQNARCLFEGKENHKLSMTTPGELMRVFLPAVAYCCFLFFFCLFVCLFARKASLKSTILSFFNRIRHVFIFNNLTQPFLAFTGYISYQ